MLLLPLYLYQYERKDDADQLARLHVSDCIECGCCAYICPGRLPLVQSIKSGKTKAQQAAAAQKAAEVARTGGKA